MSRVEKDKYCVMSPNGESKKQTNEYYKMKQSHREQTSGYQWEEGWEGQDRGRGLRGYTAKHKEFSQDFFNNHEWSIIFKIFESLCFTSEMCIIL